MSRGGLRAEVKLNRSNILRAAGGILFVLASAALHYQVKIEMAGRRGSAYNRRGVVKGGSRAPDFSAVDLQGRSVALAEFRGTKVVVLDFWAMWCGPCRRAMPALQELHEEFRDRGVEFVAVNLGEEPGRISEFVEENAYTFRVVADRESAIGERFGVRAIPLTVVVGTDGRVKFVSTGAGQTLKTRLQKTLERLTKKSVSRGSADRAEGSI